MTKTSFSLNNIYTDYLRPVLGQSFKPRWTTKSMAVLALMVAMSIVLERFLGFNSPYFKLHLGYLPVAAAGMLYGLIPGMLVGVLADIISNLGGNFSFVWVLFAALEAGLFALFLHPKMGSRAGQAVITQLFVSILIYLIINSVALKVMYNVNLSLVRLISNALTFPVRAFSLYLLLEYRTVFQKMAQ